MRNWFSSRELHEQRPVSVDAHTAVILNASSRAGGSFPAKLVQDIQIPPPKTAPKALHLCGAMQGGSASNRLWVRGS